MKNSKSFTLIELLVVVAIIGLISSIVLVNFKEAREKARIAKVLEFSQSINSALGADAVGIWTFDEGTGSTAYDSSGYGNNGTISGATYADGVVNNALSFDGVNDYVNCGSNPILKPQIITVEAWFNRGISSVSYPTIVTLWHQGVSIYMNNTAGEYTLYAMVNFTTNGSKYISFGAVPALNTWNHAVLTWDGVNVKTYYNGILKSKSPSYVEDTINYSGSYFTGVSIPSQYSGFKGLVDEVRIYNLALSSAEIQKHYAEGLEKHKDLAKK